ncbi:hypothetical protein HAX54_037506 [Datura stramonium]|uniref:Cupin type-1 domain-containing protein n=1 Tax=Datura stramonium TaxID=4076 RepID=A0ABS8SGZ7_DATST|nr:hypothetical protein [Datura stramonium]
MALKYFVLTIAILALVTSISHASDPSPLQDFCVAVNDSMAAGISVYTVFVNGKFCKDHVDKLQEFVYLGISLARIDYAPYGLNPPHTHPKSIEVLVVLEELCVFGLIHFQFNVGKTKAIAFAGLSSQNPGVITIANAVFGSDPQSTTMFLPKHSKLTRKLWITSNHNSVSHTKQD